MTMTNKKNKALSKGAEYGVDSRYESKNERESEATTLMEARLERMKNLSKDQIIQAKLMQLKLRMEEFIRQPVYDNRDYFSEFLKTYIDAIYTKRNKFAQDIDITPVRLSQVINKHREPKDDFIMRLMIHSEKVYKGICAFHKRIWYQVYFHERICDTVAKENEWRPKIEKHVKYG
jgi:hypothetical protein